MPPAHGAIEPHSPPALIAVALTPRTPGCISRTFDLFAVLPSLQTVKLHFVSLLGCSPFASLTIPSSNHEIANLLLRGSVRWFQSSFGNRSAILGISPVRIPIGLAPPSGTSTYYLAFSLRLQRHCPEKCGVNCPAPTGVSPAVTALAVLSGVTFKKWERRVSSANHAGNGTQLAHWFQLEVHQPVRIADGCRAKGGADLVSPAQCSAQIGSEVAQLYTGALPNRRPPGICKKFTSTIIRR